MDGQRERSIIPNMDTGLAFSNGTHALSLPLNR
jgi:hypothetical protein